MNFRECLNRAVDAGMLSEEEQKAARQIYDDVEREFARKFGPNGGPEQAARAVLDRLEERAIERRRKVLLQRNATQRAIAMVEGARDIKGKPSDGEGLIALMDASELAPGQSLRQHTLAIRGQLQAKMTQILEAFRPTVTGATRNIAQLTNIARELFGEATEDAAAKEMAEAFRQAAEYARLRFNAAGGEIRKLADWGMPQSHDPLKVRGVSKAEWTDFVAGKLDRSRMLDRDTALPFTDERLRDVLGEVFDTIATDGWAKREPTQRAANASLGSRRTDPRFLIFKNADAWMEYQNRFGSADAFSTMVGHLDTMAKDIAAMELFGPSPTATLNYLEQWAKKRAAEADAAAGGTKNADAITKATRVMWNAFDLERGNAARPINATWANGLYVVRNALASAQLGSAAIPAFLTDPNFARLAAGMNGLSATRMLGRYVKLLNPADAADRRLAVRLSLIADNWSQVALAQRRFSADFMGPAWSKRLSHTVMTLSGLSPHTQAMRWAFGMEFAGTLADHAGKSMAALPKELRQSFERWGINAADWEKMRKVAPYEERGAQFLRADDIASVDQKLADKMLGMIHGETEFAVPSFNLRGEAHFLGRGTEPGTFAGEMVRSGLMYRNFGITLAMTHMRRQAIDFAMAPTLSAKSRVLAGGLDLIVTMSVLGALSLQLKQIVAGRDPRSMTDANFWGAAALQGGGFGVFGDFLFTDTNAYGSGLPETVAGAPIGFLNDVRKLTIGNAFELAAGQKTNAPAEAVRFLQRYTPGSSLWYSRLAMERLLFDRLDMWVNPRAHDRMHRLEQKYRSEFGQKFWWRPGTALPARAPDLGNIASNPPERAQ